MVLTTAHLAHVPEHREDADLMAPYQRCHDRHDAADRRAGIRRWPRLAVGDPSGPVAPEAEAEW